MKFGFLRDHFSGVGAKRLSDVEVIPEISNQHEFNGVNEFRRIFGEEKVKLDAKFLFLSDEEDSLISEEGTLTWYDARQNHATRTEFRLYYSCKEIISSASSGDLVVIGKLSDNSVMIVIAKEASTAESQILWLFGLGEIGNRFEFRDYSSNDVEIGFAGSYILESLGVSVEPNEPEYFEELIQRFGGGFPTTIEFSNYARSKASTVSPIEFPDEALISWMELEVMLFKLLERYFVRKRLQVGFGADGDDVDQFVSFSLSVQNRRKSRAGHAFENHLAFLFTENVLSFSRQVKTEGNSKPDFLFPSIKSYIDLDFPSQDLDMLGVKTSVKDRWRQILVEAERIENKHLITLQPSISQNQTDEMRSHSVNLVIPSPLFPTFSKKQQAELVNVKEFISLVRKKQLKN